MTSVIVLLLDHEPSNDEIRRIQARENQREDLSLADQQRQFADCWQARAGLRDAAEEDRRRRAAERARHAEATASNLSLRHDIRAALADPSDDQLSALREIVCRLLCEHQPS